MGTISITNQHTTGNTRAQATPPRPAQGFQPFPTQRQNDTPADALKRKARRNAYGTALTTGLARITPSAQMRKAYERTRDTCGKTIIQRDGQLETTYCRARWCPTCNSHRTANIWAAYGAELSTWTNAQFVTLTVPNCEGYQLRAAIQDLTRTFANICKTLKRKGHTVHAIRATETTANAGRRTYHPHLHVLIRNHGTAHALLAEWLKRYPKADHKGQHIRKADAHSIHELTKYIAKVSGAEPNEDGTENAVPWPMLDTIYTASRGLRLLAGVGIRAATTDEETDLETVEDTVAYTATKRPTERIVWTWVQTLRDWVDRDSGEMLADYEPNDKERRWLTYLEQPPPPNASTIAASATVPATGLAA